MLQAAQSRLRQYHDWLFTSHKFWGTDTSAAAIHSNLVAAELLACTQFEMMGTVLIFIPFPHSVLELQLLCILEA